MGVVTAVAMAADITAEAIMEACFSALVDTTRHPTIIAPITLFVSSDVRLPQQPLLLKNPGRQHLPTGTTAQTRKDIFLMSRAALPSG